MKKINIEKTFITFLCVIFFLGITGSFTSSYGLSDADIKKACEIAAKGKKFMTGKLKDLFIKECVDEKKKKEKPKDAKKEEPKKDTAPAKTDKTGTTDGRTTTGAAPAAAGTKAATGGNYTLEGPSPTSYGTKVWQWSKKVLGTWTGPKNSDYMVYTIFYADPMEKDAFLKATHRGVSNIKFKGDPCLYDTRGLDEQKRGYIYMRVFQINGNALKEVSDLKFTELTGNPPSTKCLKIELPEMKE